MSEFDSAGSVFQRQPKSLAALLEASGGAGAPLAAGGTGRHFPPPNGRSRFGGPGRLRSRHGRPPENIERRAKLVAEEFFRPLSSSRPAVGTAGTDQGFCQGEHGSCPKAACPTRSPPPSITPASPPRWCGWTRASPASRPPTCAAACSGPASRSGWTRIQTIAPPSRRQNLSPPDREGAPAP